MSPSQAKSSFGPFCDQEVGQGPNRGAKTGNKDLLFKIRAKNHYEIHFPPTSRSQNGLGLGAEVNIGNLVGRKLSKHLYSTSLFRISCGPLAG